MIRCDSKIPNDTEVGHMAQNELDIDADTSCACANQTLLEYSVESLRSEPFFDMYDSVQEILVRESESESESKRVKE